jgi:hypothetical protein
VTDKSWRMLARVAGGRLLLKTDPADARELEVPWTGPPEAAYAILTQLTDWHVHEYTSSCVCRVTVHAADDRVLGEVEYEFWD